MLMLNCCLSGLQPSVIFAYGRCTFTEEPYGFIFNGPIELDLDILNWHRRKKQFFCIRLFPLVIKRYQCAKQNNKKCPIRPIYPGSIKPALFMNDGTNKPFRPSSPSIAVAFTNGNGAGRTIRRLSAIRKTSDVIFAVEYSKLQRWTFRHFVLH